MENLLFSIPQIKVHFIRSKLCLTESLGKRWFLVTLIYLEPLQKKYIFSSFKRTCTLTCLVAYKPTGLM